MPAEYRCDGACRRLLRELKNNVVEGGLQYCAEDYQRLVTARTGYQAAMQKAIDDGQLLFLHLLGDFITPPTFNQSALVDIADNVKKNPAFIPLP